MSRVPPTLPTEVLDTSGERSHRPDRGLMEHVALWALGMGLVLALLAGWFTRDYDYDELTRAHSAWLTAQGLRPYTDYFECHPPYFPLLIPIVRCFPDPIHLIRALRLFGIVGNLLFLAGLGRLVTHSTRDRAWAWLGLGVVALAPSILEFLVEFRVDGWGYALATWTLVVSRRDPRETRSYLVLGLGTGLAAGLFCPKIALLPPLILAFMVFAYGRTPRIAIRLGVAYLGGTAIAAGLVVFLLVAEGVRFADVYDLLVRYHTIANSTSSFHRGLLTTLGKHPVLLSLTLLGVAAWLASQWARRTGPHPIESGLAAWLAVQAVVVAYPYKQYYAPWFLFAAAFLVHLGIGPASRTRWWRGLVFVSVAAGSIYFAQERVRVWWADDLARRQEVILRWMDQVVQPGEWVVATHPYHPIDRRDSFFVWFNTIDPGGFDSETILARLPRFRERVTPEHFLQELEAHPPSLVTLSDQGLAVFYTEGQYAALRVFLPRHGYRTVRRGSGEFAVRPDRLNAAH